MTPKHEDYEESRNDFLQSHQWATCMGQEEDFQQGSREKSPGVNQIPIGRQELSLADVRIGKISSMRWNSEPQP